jgi:hypothetical protein
MTTERTPTDDRAARLEALRQRRAARPATSDNPTEPGAATAMPRQRARRRRRAATGGRILAGGLSAAAALGLMGAMAHATSPSTATPTTVENTPAAPTVIVIRRPGEATPVAAPVAPPVTPTVAAPVTTSRGS